MENQTINAENVKNVNSAKENEALAKVSTFKKNVLKAEKTAIVKEAKAKEKKATTKKLNEVVAVVIATENKYLYQFQKETKLSAVEQKKRRSAIRRKLFSFADAIYLANKAKTTDKLIEQINAFKAFHKQTYINQVLTLKNIFTSERDEKKTADLMQMINIIKKSSLAKEFNF